MIIKQVISNILLLNICNTTSIISHKTDSYHLLYTLNYTSLLYKHMIQLVASIMHIIKANMCVLC